MKKQFPANRYIALLLCVLLVSAFFTPALNTFAQVETEPMFNPSENKKYEITGYGNGVFSENTLNVAKENNAYFETDLSDDAAYYMTLTIKTDGQLNINHRTLDTYINIQKEWYSSKGTGGQWVNKSFANITTGLRITIYSSMNEIKIWADGEKIVDSAYSAGGTSKPGIGWTFDKPVIANDIIIWTDESPESSEPVFDAEKHTAYEITDYGNGIFENNALIVNSQSSSNFTTELSGDAAYYMTLTVKTDGQLNINHRTLDTYINIQKEWYSSKGTGGQWVNRVFPTLTTGLRITIYSSMSEVKIWADGVKIVDSAYSAGGTAKPGISWTFDKEVIATNIKIWTDKESGGEEPLPPTPPENESDKPVYDSEKHYKYDILSTTSGEYKDNSLTVAPLSKSYFETELTPNADYYMTMNIKTNNSANISYRTEDGFLNIQKLGYKCSGTNGEWVNKKFPQLEEGVRITLYSSPEEIKIWLDGEKIIDEEYIGSGISLPGISWSFEDTVTVSDVTIWTQEKLISDEPEFDPQKHNNININESTAKIDPLSSFKFETDLSYESDYYMSFRIKTEGGANIGYRSPDGFLNIQSNGYKSAGTNGEWINKSFPFLATGVRVTVYSAKNHISIWVGKEKIVDEEYSTDLYAEPGIYWSFNNEISLSNIKIWTDKESGGEEPLPPTPPENESDEPVYDSEKHYKYDILSTTSGEFKNNSLTVAPLSKSYFETELTPNADYYMTMNIKTNNSANISYRTEDGFLNIQKLGYKCSGTNGEWVNKKFPQLEEGVRITLYSSPEEIKIWLDGEKIIDEEYVGSGISLPGISWSFEDTVTVSDIAIWTQEKLISDEPEFDPQKHTSIKVEGTESGEYVDGILKIEPQSSAILKTDLSYKSDYYMSFRIKTEGSANIGYRSPDGFLNIQSNGYKSAGTNGEWINKSFPFLATGVRVTVYSAKNHISIWVGGEKIVDEDYITTLPSVPGIYWSFENEIVLSNIKIWHDAENQSELVVPNSDEPVYDSEKHYKYDILSTTSGEFKDNSLTVAPLSKSYFETELTPNADYYMTMNIKTNNSVNISYRTEDGFLNIQKLGYKCSGTNGEWVNKKFPQLEEGVRITLYSSPEKIKIWLDGEKIIDEEYIGSGISLPGISWSFEDTVTVSDITIWTQEKLISDEPEFDPQKHTSIKVEGTESGEYVDGILKIEPQSSAILKTDLSYKSDYYMSFRIKTEGSANIGYRSPDGFLNIQSNGYKSAGTNGEWINKSFPFLATGVRVTVYSAKNHISIWVGGEKIVDEKYTAQGEVLPGIYWSFDDLIEITNLMIWADSKEDEVYLGDIESTPEETLSGKKPFIEASQSIKEENITSMIIGENYQSVESEFKDAQVTVTKVEHTKPKNYTVYIIIICSSAILSILATFVILLVKLKKKSNNF